MELERKVEQVHDLAELLIHLATDCAERQEHPPPLFLITGASGSGKTTGCLHLVEQARSDSYVVGGLLSPAVFTGKRKTGIDLVDLSSGERRRLATLKTTEQATSLTTDEWQFDASALAWGNDRLHRLRSCDLLVLDELGPLEYYCTAGLQEGFRLIQAQRYRLACLTIRPSLLAVAQQRWPWARVVDVTVNTRRHQAGRRVR